jgi:hypothetical protein
MANSWWVVLEGKSVVSQILGALTPGGLIDPTQNATAAVVIQSATKPSNYYKGPYTTQAQAEAQAKAYNSPTAGSEAEQVLDAGPASGSGSSWALQFGNFKGLAGRILKVVFGSALIIIGVAKMSGATSKLPAVLGKVPV